MDNGARKVASGYDESGKEVVEILAAHNALSEGADLISQSIYMLSETIIRGLLPDERCGGLGGDFGYGVNFENEVFSMRRHYEDCDCGADGSDKDHESTCCLMQPNFRHKRTGQEISWYKWIGRDMQADPEHIENWKDIWMECWESLPEDARERARKEREYEQTPEYKKKHEEAMTIMMSVADKMFSEMQPCYRCSMDGGFSGGQTITCDGLTIAKTLRDDNGACVNCGHVTTDEERIALAERQEAINAGFRDRLCR